MDASAEAAPRRAGYAWRPVARHGRRTPRGTRIRPVPLAFARVGSWDVIRPERCYQAWHRYAPSGAVFCRRAGVIRPERTRNRWGAAVDSNHLPPRYQHGALPDELAAQLDPGRGGR